jgi:hypothetical protein
MSGSSGLVDGWIGFIRHDWAGSGLIIKELAGRMKTEDRGWRIEDGKKWTTDHGPKGNADSAGFAGARRRSRQVEVARRPEYGRVVSYITSASLADSRKWGDVAATPKCGVNAKALRVEGAMG